MIVRSTLAKGAFAIAAAALLAFAVSAGAANPQLAARTDAALGEHLVDGSGRTLYLFVNDADGASTCYDACATNWPPLLTDGGAVAMDGVDADLVGTTERTDGAVQVTYGGWPLYFFVGDAEPGTTAGQAVNEVWYLVAADGTAIGADAQGDAAGSDDAAFEALMNEGARVFHTICAACHGVNGDEQLASHVVELAGNSRLDNDRLVLRRVIHGGGYMPGFGGNLSDREVAAVATYVRNSFGNDFGSIGEEAAAAER